MALSVADKKKLKDKFFREGQIKCPYCTQKFQLKFLGNVDIDHIIPVKCGGSNDESNLQLLCGACNNRKSASCDGVFRRRFKALGLPQQQGVSPTFSISHNEFALLERTLKRAEAAVTKPMGLGDIGLICMGITRIQAHQDGLNFGVPESACGEISGKLTNDFDEINCHDCLQILLKKSTGYKGCIETCWQKKTPLPNLK